MREDPDDAPVALERAFELRRGRARSRVLVQIRTPVPGRIGRRCAFSVRGLGAPPRRTSHAGLDSVAALDKAMRLAMA